MTDKIHISFVHACGEAARQLLLFFISSGCIVVVPRELEVAGKMKMDCVFFFFGAEWAIPLIRRGGVRNENRSMSKTNMLRSIDEFVG